jgi:hypothetical protein
VSLYHKPAGQLSPSAQGLLVGKHCLIKLNPEEVITTHQSSIAKRLAAFANVTSEAIGDSILY